MTAGLLFKLLKDINIASIINYVCMIKAVALKNKK